MNKDITAVCPKCKSFIYTTRQNFFDLNVSYEILEKLATREYFCIDCHKCGFKTSVLDRTEVMNTDKKYYVIFDSDPSYFLDRLKNDTDFKRQLEGYLIRYTNTLDDFIEKLSIFENCHLDTEIEIIKSYINLKLTNEKEIKIKEIRYMGDSDNDMEAFFMLKEQNSNEHQSFKFPIFSFLKKIKKEIPKNFSNNIVVNKEQAFKYVLNNEKLRELFNIKINKHN